MGDARLEVLGSVGLEPEPGVQRLSVDLRVQSQRLVAVVLDHHREQTAREALPAAVGAGDDAADESAGILIAGLRGVIYDDAQAGRGAALVGDPPVLGGGFAVARIELGLIDALLEEEDFGAQCGEFEELVETQFGPGSTLRGRVGHVCEFNGARIIRPRAGRRGTMGHNPAADGKTYAVKKTEAEWRAELGEERYQVLRQAGTERAWTGELLDESRAGLYTCGACNAELFQAGTKFDSGCGWPSFYDSVRPEAVELLEDTSLGMVRTEVRCATCGSHLGHVFPDGFGTPTGDRYCMNSLALNFTPESE